MNAAPQPLLLRRASRLLVVVTLLALLAGLAATAYAGAYTRFWADDYCYSGEAQENGLLAGTLDWYQTGGNRFAAFWGVAASDWLGVRVVSWLPGLLLAAWVAAAWVALTRVAGRLGVQAWPGWFGLAAVGWVFFTALMAPHRLQTLYWRMGLLHYSLPLVFFFLNAGLLARAWPSSAGKRLPWLALILSAWLALVAAGLSETYAAFQTGALLLALGCTLWLGRGLVRRRGLALLAAPLAASLLAMVLMALAPANAWRQAEMPPPAGIGQLLGYTLQYTLDFAIDTLKTVPLPLAVFLALAAALGLLAGDALTARANTRSLILAGLLSLLGSLALAACAIAPSVYAGLQYPAGRALMVARFGFLLGAGLAAFLAGGLLYRLAAPRWGWRPALAGLLVLLVVSAYGLRSLALPLSEAREMAVKAARWDARHAQILSARLQGVRDITVPELDVVTSLEDLSPLPSAWVNVCAAHYYQVESITALP